MADAATLPVGSQVSGARRLWSAPLWAHLVLLTAVLGALAAATGAEARFMSDEGAAMGQVEAILDGSWYLENRLEGIDPDARWFAFEKSSISAEGGAPYPKKLSYPVVLTPFTAVAGSAGAVAVSVLGTVAAAGFAALVARRFATDRSSGPRCGSAGC